LKKEVEAAVIGMLEDTTGQNQIKEIMATIDLAKKERAQHEKGTYLYNLLSEDIVKKEADLARYEQELGTGNIEAAVRAYQQKVADFFQFLNGMRGRYDKATFQEKRNAIEVLGVRVVVHEPLETYGISSDASDTESDQEWFSAREAARLLGVDRKTIYFYQRNGTIAKYKYEPFLLVHRDELLKLQRKGFLQRNTEEIVRDRVEISYSPRFSSMRLTSKGDNPTGVWVSLQTRRYIKVSVC